MSRPIHRMAIAMLLLVAGAAAVIYAAVRTVPVIATVTVEKEEIVLERPPAIFNAPPGGPRSNLPPLPPIPKRVKKSVAQDEQQLHHESRLVRDVTVGGIARTAGGILKFTYGAGEDGPALCPT